MNERTAAMCRRALRKAAWIHDRNEAYWAGLLAWVEREMGEHR
jgi:hypothetical protein